MTSSIWKQGHKNSINQYITSSAIKELQYSTTEIAPIFTLQSEDYNGLISLPKAYSKYYQDTTDYNFVKEYFDGDFLHWEAFINNPKIAPIMKNLKKTNEKRLESEAIAKIVNIAFDDDNKNNLSALKMLVNGDKIKKKVETNDIIPDTDLKNDIERLQEFING